MKQKVTESTKPKTLFDHIKQITGKQDPNYFSTLSESDLKTWNNYMILRFISMNKDWLELLGQLQPYIQELEPRDLYKILIEVLPKGNTFLKYVKSDAYQWYEEWVLEHMMTYFECSKRDAIDYLEICYATDDGKKKIKEICEAYGEDPKKIAKLKLGV